MVSLNEYINGQEKHPGRLLLRRFHVEVNFDLDIGRDLGLSFNKSKMPEWTQDLIAERTVKDGIVVYIDQKGKKRFVKILEIVALNFPIMSATEQDNCILSYADLLKGMESSFHIKVITTFSNIDDYVAKARESYYNEKDPSCKSMIARYINYLQNEGGLDTYRKHYYFIFELEAEELRGVKSEEEIIAKLKRKSESVSSAFRSMGNEVLLDTEKDNGRISEILYYYYNRRTSKDEVYNDRVERVKLDREKVKTILPGSDIPFDFRNLIAPKSIDFNESPSYMVIDGMYRSHFFVRGSSMPSYMITQNGWLAGIINFGYGFDVDMYFIKSDISKKDAAIKTTMKIANYKMQNTSPSQDNYEEVQESAASANWYRSAIRGGHQTPYDIVVLITVWASTLEELEFRKTEMKKAARQLDVVLYECKRYQEEAFYSTGYTMDLRPKLMNVGKRNLTSDGVAAAYPFTSFNLADKNGIALGYNRDNSSIVMYDPFDSGYNNANIFTVGGSGSGKTYAMMLIASRMRYLGIQNFIFAPEKQEEYGRLCDAMGGEYIDFSSTSKKRINPLEIRPLSSPIAAFLGGESYEEKSWVVDKVENMLSLLNHLIRDLSQAENAQLEIILVRLYERFGMTEDNNSIYEDEAHTRLKKMPILADLYNDVRKAVERGELRREIALILYKFIDGACRNLNGQTNVDLDNKFIVFGIEHVKEDMLASTMFILMNLVWDRVRQDRTERKMIHFEEGWKLLENDNDEVGKFVKKVYKLIRGFGGGANFATQEVGDIVRSKHGSAIIANSHCKIVLGMEKSQVDSIAGLLGLSDKETIKVARQKKGKALFCAGFNHIPIQIKSFDREHEVFTTDANELSAQAQQIADEQNN